MNILMIVILSVSVIYMTVLVISILFLKDTSTEEKIFAGDLSVIIPFRDEADRLPKLFQSLESFPAETQIIFADDHSSDTSAELIRNYFSKSKKRVLLLQPELAGKKQVVAYASQYAEANWILFLDADIWFEDDLLTNISAHSINAKMICGFTLVNPENLFSGIQFLDTLAMQSVAQAYSNLGMPFLCSASCMMIRKDIYQDYLKNEKVERSSGDDVFLLHYVKRTFGPSAVQYRYHPNACVYTNAESDLGHLIRQRIRWAGKAGSYKQGFAIFISLIVALNAIGTLVGLILTAINPTYLPFALICILLRIVIEFLLLFLSSRKFGLSRAMLRFVPAFVFELIWIPFISLASIFIRNKWKGRNVQ